MTSLQFLLFALRVTLNVLRFRNKQASLCYFFADPQNSPVFWPTLYYSIIIVCSSQSARHVIERFCPSSVHDTVISDIKHCSETQVVAVVWKVK